MRVYGGGSHDSLKVASSECQVMEVETSADLAVLWLRARQLFCVGGHAPQSCEIIGFLKKLKDGMPADPAGSLKADEEDRKTNQALLVAVTENVEVATLTATIETVFPTVDEEVFVTV